MTQWTPFLVQEHGGLLMYLGSVVLLVVVVVVVVLLFAAVDVSLGSFSVAHTLASICMYEVGTRCLLLSRMIKKLMD